MNIEDIHAGGIYVRREGTVWEERREVISILEGPATVRYRETTTTGLAATGVWACDLAAFARWAHRRVLAGGAPVNRIQLEDLGESEDADLDAPLTPEEEAELDRRRPVEEAITEAEMVATAARETDLAACIGAVFFLWDLGEPGIKHAAAILRKEVAKIRESFVAHQWTGPRGWAYRLRAEGGTILVEDLPPPELACEDGTRGWSRSDHIEEIARELLRHVGSHDQVELRLLRAFADATAARLAAPPSAGEPTTADALDIAAIDAWEAIQSHKRASAPFKRLRVSEAENHLFRFGQDAPGEATASAEEAFAGPGRCE